MDELLNDMRDRVLRHADSANSASIVPRLNLGTATAPSDPVSIVYDPIVCVVLQGAKQVMIGEQVLRYDVATSFITSLELPASGRIIEATPDRPYAAAGLLIDLDIVAELIADLPETPDRPGAGFFVMPVTAELLAAWQQLIALLDAPGDVRVLAPLRERELLYRLLCGPHAAVLRQIARGDSRLAQVRRTIQWLRGHFDQAMRIEQLAEMAGMSVPSFHRHFKAATAMSPLQYQKSLRLQAARRLLAANAEASRAAYSVGYESASQFSREYARMFGAPPSRDAERLRGAAVVL
jgi:AraC-like DNA-binding protein